MDILITNFNKKYNNSTVLDIDMLHIESEEVIGIVGNNGAGKSTMLKGILDFIKIDRGTVLIDGLLNYKFDSWKEHTAAFLGNDFLIDFLTPLEYFYFVGSLYGLHEKKIETELKRYKEFFNVEIDKSKLIKNLSSGNKQKVGIIGALIPNSKLLIFDEPYVYLDPSSQFMLTKIFKDLKDEKKTIMISSHDFIYLSEFCTRFLFVEKGNIVKDLEGTDSSVDSMRSFFTK